MGSLNATTVSSNRVCWQNPERMKDCSTLPCSDRLSIQRDKAHILFGGTRILQHTGDKAARIRTPDGGCLAVVLRTGFDTSQGKGLIICVR